MASRFSTPSSTSLLAPSTLPLSECGSTSMFQRHGGGYFTTTWYDLGATTPTTRRRAPKPGIGASQAVIAVDCTAVTIPPPHCRLKRVLRREPVRSSRWSRTTPHDCSLSTATKVGRVRRETRRWTPRERLGCRPRRFVNGTEWFFRTRSVHL